MAEESVTFSTQVRESITSLVLPPLRLIRQAQVDDTGNQLVVADTGRLGEIFAVREIRVGIRLEKEPSIA